MGRRPAWLTPAFRICNALQVWAMLDVFLLGLLVAYFRLRASLEVTLGAGAICFIIAAILSLVARATLDKAQVWRLMSPDRPWIRGPSMVCLSCELVMPRADGPTLCPRCRAVVTARKKNPYSRSIALLLAAGLMYLPANIYPIATIPIDFRPTSYTVLGGVIDLLRSHLLGLAALVFTASFTIPLLKMLGLAWCASSALCGSRRFLVGRTRVFRVVEEIGRWSMVDPLTIACFVPVLQFNALIDGHAEPAVVPFSAVVILTTLAVQLFDPRTMWDVAKRSR
jgi:paraquat-inducible protein A